MAKEYGLLNMDNDGQGLPVFRLSFSAGPKENTA